VIQQQPQDSQQEVNLAQDANQSSKTKHRHLDIDNIEHFLHAAAYKKVTAIIKNSFFFVFVYVYSQ
jgi:hypothetical protein